MRRGWRRYGNGRKGGERETRKRNKKQIVRQGARETGRKRHGKRAKTINKIAVSLKVPEPGFAE